MDRVRLRRLTQSNKVTPFPGDAVFFALESLFERGPASGRVGLTLICGRNSNIAFRLHASPDSIEALLLQTIRIASRRLEDESDRARYTLHSTNSHNSIFYENSRLERSP